MVKGDKAVMMSFPLATLLSLLLAQSAFASGGVSTTAMLATVSEIPHRSVTVPVTALLQASKKDQRLLIHDDVWVAKAKVPVRTR